MNLFDKFTAGLPLPEFLAKYGSDTDRAKWARAAEQTQITAPQKELLAKFTRRTNVLVLAGAWCGDCAGQCPIFERLLVEDGILLRKYWFSVSDEEQQRRFQARLEDPMRQWKLSAMDLESIKRWEDYSRAKDEMMVHTDVPEAPWYVVESDVKRQARLNMMAHLLSTLPYADVPTPTLELPPRPQSRGYERTPREHATYVPDHYATLVG